MQSAATFESQVPRYPTPLLCPFSISSTLISLLPGWSSHAPSQVHVSPLLGGLSNSIYKATLPNAVPSSVLVRIFGVPQLLPPSQRAVESIIFEQLSDARIAPRLLANLPNGRVEQFLEARNIQLHEMTHHNILRGVARAMAQMHKFRPLGVGVEIDLSLWSDMSKWMEEIEQLVQAGKLEMPAGVCLKRCKIRMQQLREELDRSACPVVFCHNDLWSGNIMVDMDGTTVSFVDFEFSAFNYRGFDIGNFFSEAAWGKVDDAVQKPGYPSIRQRRIFCQEYLKSIYGYSEGASADMGHANALMEEAERFGQAAHLHWGLWALKLNVESSVSYPYLDFAQHRLQQFLK